MRRAWLYAAFGWLALGGVLHFSIDVAAQYLRGARAPGPETTLYYGLNSAFALGQVLFGLLCLWLVRHAPELFRSGAVVALCLAAAVGWLGIALGFMAYWEPKFVAAMFGVLFLAACLAR